MARLRELLQARFADLVASRVRRADHDIQGDQRSRDETPEDQRHEKDILRLLALLDEREQLIRRLKLTDGQRETLHMRMKLRWRAKQAEVAKMREQMRVLRRLLRSRRHEIRDLMQARRNFDEFLRKVYTTPGLDPPPVEASPPPPRGVGDSLVRRLLSCFPSVARLQWRHWMRLGVLRQYEAHPLRPDRIPVPRAPAGGLPK